MNLWTVAKLTQLPFSLRRKLRFHAPLLESLDFMGVEPITFARASTSIALFRDGVSHSISAHVPRFEYFAGLPTGLMLSVGETLQFAAQNELHNTDTLIWFEEMVPKSTPTNTNPFNSSGAWVGNRETHISLITKADHGVTLTAAEINQIQQVLGGAIQSISSLPVATYVYGNFVIDEFTPSGTVFTLSNDPDLNALRFHAHGGTLHRIAASPGQTEFTATGTGSRTITLGMAATSISPVWAQYPIAGA